MCKRLVEFYCLPKDMYLSIYNNNTLEYDIIYNNFIIDKNNYINKIKKYIEELPQGEEKTVFSKLLKLNINRF